MAGARSSTSSTISRRSPASSSSTTTAIERGRRPYGEVAHAARAFAARLRAAGHRPRDTRSPSGARTGRSGSSRSGAACSKAVVARADRLPRLGDLSLSRRGHRRRARDARRRTSSTPPTLETRSAGLASDRPASTGTAATPTVRRRHGGRAASSPERRTTRPRSSSRPARPPIPKASSSPIATSWRTSSRSSARSRSTGINAKPFLPIRFLNLLPLSHMFGQAMATFVPPMLPGLVDLHAQLLARRHPAADPDAADLGARLRAEDPRGAAGARRPACTRRRRRRRPTRCTGRQRWWHYRRVHRLFGLKFWAFVVGAAPLDPELEAFWGRLGFVVDSGVRSDGNCADRDPEPSAARRPRCGRQADRRRRGEDRRGRRDPRARRERHARILQRAGRDPIRLPGRLVPHRRHRRTRRAPGSSTSAAARKR